MPPSQPSELTARLLDWYAGHRRHLPWRQTDDPYRIWVAEVMLQQTQVDTVVPYYARFLDRFPTMEALAAAPLDDVLKRWEGLGYYARARNLHAAAQKIVAEHASALPETEKDLLALPGIGSYTAGAILSIAFGQDASAIDGNARRVLSRLFAVADDVTRGPGQRRLQTLAESLLPPGRAGDFNQALMDLGATLCTPRAPVCDACPLSGDCRAHRLGQQEAYPVRRPRGPVPHYDVAAGVIWNGEGRFLVAQRPLDGMLGGLWEFPGGKCEPGEALPDCLRRELAEELGIRVAVGPQVAKVAHAYTHFRITLHAFHCRIVSEQPRALGCADWRWITLADVPRFAFPAADHRVIAALRQSENAPPKF